MFAKVLVASLLASASAFAPVGRFAGKSQSLKVERYLVDV